MIWLFVSFDVQIMYMKCVPNRYTSKISLRSISATILCSTFKFCRIALTTFCVLKKWVHYRISQYARPAGRLHDNSSRANPIVMKFCAHYYRSWCFSILNLCCSLIECHHNRNYQVIPIEKLCSTLPQYIHSTKRRNSGWRRTSWNW
jgi:hypothetical protein